MPDSQATLHTLAAISAHLAGDQPLDEILDAITQAARQLLSCAASGIWLHRRASQRLELVSSHAMSFPLLAEVRMDDESVVGLAAARRAPVAIDEREVHSESFISAGLRSGAALPLIWHGSLYGVLVVSDTPAWRVFGADDLMTAGLLAQMAAGAVASTLFRKHSDQLEAALIAEQERLLHTQVAIRQMLDEPDSYATLVEVTEALRALGWRRVTLALVDGDMAVRDLIALGVPEDEQARFRQGGLLPAGVWEAVQRGELKTQAGSGVYFVPGGDPGGADWHPADLVFAPLRVGQGVLDGIVRVGDPVDERRPDSEALRPLDILVSQAAYIAENARLLGESQRNADALAERVDELSMLHQADRELSSHRNVGPILQLTIDWALRRTGAETGLVLLMTDDRRGLVPALTVGNLDRAALHYDEQHPMPVAQGVIGRAARSGETQVVRQIADDSDSVAFLPSTATYLAVPISMRGEVLGVMVLASTRQADFSDYDRSFLEQLGRRAAVAIDNARLFRQAEQLADDMTMLYSASRIITSTLEQDEILQRIAQGMTMVLECTSAVILDYVEDSDEAHVLTVYRAGSIHESVEILPELNHAIRLDTYPAFRAVLSGRRSLALRVADPGISAGDRQHLERDRIHAALMVPLLAQDEIVGLAVVIEGRRDRVFSTNEIFKAEALASQASLTMRQSALFGEVRELERLKSEMIRMASHDLRNPLNNIIGYVELIAMTLDPDGPGAPDLNDYLNQLRRSSQMMKQLLEDLLTLERIESERQSEWQPVDLGQLVVEVVEASQSDARLKDQALILEGGAGGILVQGSQTQLRQAIANLVGNAIKYTPEGGRVEVHLDMDAGRLRFAVIDNGYGISPERQGRLFERFYRAREEGTEHIGGTGLGLSLVKTVIERHGGLVWVESASGAGSTFGFWLPVTPGG